MTSEDNEVVTTNGSVGKVRVTAEVVSHKIEGFHLADEVKTQGKGDPGSA